MGEFPQEVVVARSRINNRFRLVVAAVAVGVAPLRRVFRRFAHEPDSRRRRLSDPDLPAGRVHPVAGDSTAVRAQVLVANGTAPAAGVDVHFGEMLGKRSGSWVPAGPSRTGRMGADCLPSARGLEGQTTLKATAGSVSAYASLTLVAALTECREPTLSSPSGAAALAADGVSSLALRVTATRGTGQQPVGSLTVCLTAGDRFVDLDGTASSAPATSWCRAATGTGTANGIRWAACPSSGHDRCQPAARFRRCGPIEDGYDICPGHRRGDRPGVRRATPSDLAPRSS